jgi:two-component system cell cycle response regulator CtrA
VDESARIKALEAENERLSQRVEQLEASMGVVGFTPPVEWRLTGSETRVMGVLLKREVATKDAIMAALYCADARDEAEVKIVDVFICKIRKKLKPFGIQIATRWGQGYSIQGRSELASMVGGSA